MHKQAPDYIRKGWHEWFAWYPVGVLGERGFAWLETVERKYYQPNRTHVVKAGLNEDRFVSYMPVEVMYRRPGVDAERTTYYTRSGSAYADPDEIWEGLSEDYKDQITNSLDRLEE